MWEPQPLTTLRASKACRGKTVLNLARAPVTLPKGPLFSFLASSPYFEKVKVVVIVHMELSIQCRSKVKWKQFNHNWNFSKICKTAALKESKKLCQIQFS
jgi:hypothetical protein